MNANSVKPMIEVTRGSITEIVHFGAAAVVDSTEKLIASFGDPNLTAFLRSSAKPFQALPVFECGAVDHYQFTEKEIAIMCASHSSTDEHLETINGMQAKVGIQESDLMCGTHPPIDKETWKTLLLRREEPSQNRHNCSGKHTGMLAQAKQKGLSFENYIDLKHPIQQADLLALSEMCDMNPEDVKLGIDGCSVPVHAIPLQNAALGFARLMDPHSLPEKRANACRRITHAMGAYPSMVAGPKRFDTVLMEAFEGKVIAKIGADGYQAVGVLPGVLSPDSPGIGITIKIADGDVNGHARHTATLEILRQLGYKFTTKQKEMLKEYDCPPVRNWRKLVIGETRPVFELKQYAR